MHRLDRGDDGHVRAHELVSGVISPAWFMPISNTANFARCRAARERQRHAPVIIVGRGRCVRFGIRRKREPQRLLGAGLADRAGDRDHLGGRARARGARQIAQSFQHVGDDQQRCFGRKLRALVARDHCEAGAGLERGIDEFMAVAVIACMAKKASPRAKLRLSMARPGDLRRQRAGFFGVHGLGHVVDGPERAHATFSFKAAATAS